MCSTTDSNGGFAKMNKTKNINKLANTLNLKLKIKLNLIKSQTIQLSFVYILNDSSSMKNKKTISNLFCTHCSNSVYPLSDRSQRNLRQYSKQKSN